MNTSLCGILSLVVAVWLAGCAGQPEQLAMQQPTPRGAPPQPPQTITFPNGTTFGGASGRQASDLAQIMVEANNNNLQEYQQLREAFETFPHSAWGRQLRLAHDVRCNIHAYLHGPFQVQSNNILEIVVRLKYIRRDWPLGLDTGDTAAQRFQFAVHHVFIHGESVSDARPGCAACTASYRFDRTTTV